MNFFVKSQSPLHVFLSFNKFLRSKIFTDKSVQLVAAVGDEDCCEEAAEGCEEI